MKTMASAPRDRIILAWHKIWDCWISIRWYEGQWLEATTTHIWPEDAFTHWIEPPEC